MSRSGSRAGLVVAGVALAVSLPASAVADTPPSPSATESARPPHVWVPEPLQDPVSFPVLDISSDVIDLVLVSQNLEGTTTVESSNKRLDLTLDSKVLFGKDSAVLRPQARQQLAEVVRQLRERGPGRILIEGHTDDLGSAEHGYVLSRQRAAAVQQVIGPQLSGYPLRTVGKGEDEPRVPNSNEKNRSLNRRVEIHYTAAGD